MIIRNYPLSLWVCNLMTSSVTHYSDRPLNFISRENGFYNIVTGKLKITEGSPIDQLLTMIIHYQHRFRSLLNRDINKFSSSWAAVWHRVPHLRLVESR